MKKSILCALAIAAAVSTSVAIAQQKSDDTKGKDMPKKTAAAKQPTHTATGEVKEVDARDGTVTIAHGRIKTLNWPAMTMRFVVKDKMLLDKFAVGEKVEIQFQQEEGKYVVTAVK